MLVGEVRWAMTAVGSSCRLSGGSQLSCGPTWRSKKAQVRRDRPRRKRSSSVVGTNSVCAGGLPNHQAMAGDASHSNSSGAATTSATGLDSNARNTTAPSSGLAHISR